MKSGTYKAVFQAVLAAALFGISSPISKILLTQIPPALMAALLYLGAGLGMSLLNLVAHKTNGEVKEGQLTHSELPYIAGMIILDIAAPICLMAGLTMTTAANASLLNNFEIVATALIALILFKEGIGKRLWIAISLITAASIILSFEDLSSFSFSLGSVFVLLACVCWGFENNCTKMLSFKNPMHIVILKGFGSGLGSLLIFLLAREPVGSLLYIPAALALGFVAYGLSIYFYISAQRVLGAARTSAYYAVAPFIGTALSFGIFHDQPSLPFVIALLIMITGAYFATSEKHSHLHNHPAITHEHRHSHGDGHHSHKHDEGVNGEHCHVHTHEECVHTHSHTPDLHHSHTHQS